MMRKHILNSKLWETLIANVGEEAISSAATEVFEEEKREVFPFLLPLMVTTITFRPRHAHEFREWAKFWAKEIALKSKNSNGPISEHEVSLADALCRNQVVLPKWEALLAVVEVISLFVHKSLLP
jgi:hypothetical protein